MTPDQLKQARLLLGLTKRQVADMVDLSTSTIEDFEAGLPVNHSLVDAIHVALEVVGIEFREHNGRVELRPPCSES